MERTQKDIDIARMSALKSAVDLISAFPDKITATGNDGVITTALKTADIFLKWIQKGELQRVPQPAPQPPAPGPEPGRRGNRGNGDRPNNNAKGLEELAFKSGFVRRGAYSIPGNDMPVSGKQYGYAVSLYRKLGVDHDPVWLNSLTAKQASFHIDELKWRIEHPDGGQQ